VTLEEWYFFGDRLNQPLKLIIEQRMRDQNIPLKFVYSMPYSVCSIGEFEQMSQVINNVGIETFMSRKVDHDEKRKLAFYSFMRSDFPEKIKKVKPLFTEEYEEIFKEYMDNREGD